jgi:TonB-linked SusC/RagA family outer membrane protein
LNGSGSGFLSDVLETYDLSAANSPGIPGTGYSKSVILSYLGRANYSFKNKYLITASLRADGSSKYSTKNKWGYFPSAAFAWRIKEEPFLKENGFIDDLKLRTSWGITGSQAINAYQTLTQLTSGITAFGDGLYVTYAPGGLLPGDLKWETTEQVNFGIDFIFLNSRYQFTADFYLKNTNDLLNPVSLPASLGYSNTIQNVGKISNKGVELSLDSKILTGHFKWNLNTNFALNRSKVIKLYDGQDILTGSFSHPLITDNAKLIREGESLGVFYGYLSDGYDENGIEQYKDLEEDGVINQLDKTIIGNPNPSFIYGFNSEMFYKNFELTLFVQGTHGNDILNISGISTIDYQGGLNLPKDVYYNHWTQDNTNAKYPKISKFSTARYSDRQIEDGSFLRLKNIQFAYSLPLKKLNITDIKNAKVYFSGQNLLTLTNYSWWDPEINSGGEQGLDHYRYPTAKTYSVGIKVTF